MFGLLFLVVWLLLAVFWFGCCYRLLGVIWLELLDFGGLCLVGLLLFCWAFGRLF